MESKNSTGITEHNDSKYVFMDDFNDGNFTNNLEWSFKNANIAPGVVNISNSEAQIIRSGAGGSGRSVGIDIDVDIDITRGLTLTFDAKPVSRSVRRGCGDSCSEHPINIQLYLEDAQQNKLNLRYSVNFGNAIKDISEPNFKQFAFNSTHERWLRNIFDAWPQAVKIKKIYVFGAGWDFEGHIDNIVIE